MMFTLFVCALLCSLAMTQECPEIACVEPKCPDGYKMDEKGCTICECKGTNCGPETCMNECQQGRKLNQNGCPTCECNPECGNEMCFIECAQGFKKDQNGCNMCECAPEPVLNTICSQMTCMNECPRGRKLDQYGCSTCECKEECGNKMCMMHCSQGFKKDQDGCDMCECMPEPVVYRDPCEDVECDDGTQCMVFTLTTSGHKIPKCIDNTVPTQCQPPMDVGTCKASKSRWFYNTDTKQCEAFAYGGCKGNANNYQSERACQLNCVPGTVPEPGECPEQDCTNTCPSGHIKDDQGCNTCECVSDCSSLTCLMKCPSGFKKDEMGCDTCECNTEVCRSMELCGLPCSQFGRARDENDCEICECRDTMPCSERIDCERECRFGFVRSSEGCKTCECKASPCKGMKCAGEEECIELQNGAEWKTKCISLHESRPWCGHPMPICAMHCAHGFAYDQYGCERCHCLESVPACTLQECTEPCSYGNKYDSNGCKTCDCLDNPCQMSNCSKSEACEVLTMKNCPSCPASTKCLRQDEVRRISVRINYFYDGTENDIIESEDLKELEMKCKQKLKHLLNIREQYLHGVKVIKSPDEEHAVSLRFHIISFGDYKLWEIYENFKDKIENYKNNVTILYKQTRFVPEHSSLVAEYSSSSDVPDSDLYEDNDVTNDDDQTQTVMIGALIAAGGVALLVVIIVMVTIGRSKSKKSSKKKNEKKERDVIYKKAPVKDASLA